MDLQTIYSEFKALSTSESKVNYLRMLQTLNLPYEINYENLIKYWGSK